MPDPIDIDDPTDPRLADYVALRDASLRRHLESEQGLFIAEGEKVIRRAIEAGYRPRSFMLAPRWLASLQDVVRDAPVYRVSEQTAERVSGFHVHRGALASLHRETRHTMAGLLGLRRLMVCEDIVDHTNMGAILRNAAGLGWDGVLLAPRCADPLYRRSIKTSMGAVFSLPWARVDDWGSAVPTLQASGFTVIALALTDGAVELDAAASALGSDDRVAVLLGTEGAGLSDRWIEQADVVVTIPMRAGVDSLNVAAASAIAGYVLR
ncbi:MAG: RNA methyltransferase [Micropruina sp.]|uniref:TrmH family RNA methyltransferase n=1 Tax=Micropruina sp. TaxID=2737536 RepID=UPI0039E5E9FC